MSYQSETVGMLGMVERGCELYMRIGGGPLTDEGGSSGRPRVKLTAEQRARAIELGRTGKHSITDIANDIGANYQATYKVLVSAGIKTARK